MGKLFGTDGVRGIANSELTPRLAFQLGQAGAYVLSKNAKHKPTILVGKDTRISGDMLSSALIAGILSSGANALIAGVVPTPAVSYLTRLHHADAGVVISASHNPAEFNGIKFFNADGFKLSDEIEDEIEDILLKDTLLPVPTGKDLGTYIHLPNGVGEYVSFALSTVDIDLSGMKIALDCANGASSVTSPKAIQRLGAKTIVIHNDPDGWNINDGCGSTHIESLQKCVVENHCDIGLAFDGDADRLLAVDELGNEVNGDQIMAICAIDMKKKGTLAKNTLVATVMSNLGLFLTGEEVGINIPKTKVGDRYVLEEMQKGGYNLGGEQSGHIIFLDHNTTGDGLISALQLLSVLKASGKRLSFLAAEAVTILPQALVNAHVKNENKATFMEDAEIKSAIAEVEAKFAGSGRVLIRASGTEPLVRVMIEGTDKDEIQAEAERLAALIQGKMG